MRRIRQQLSQDECVDILCQSTSGVLAVMGDGGYPYAVPLDFFYRDRKLYFHSAVEGHKVDALKACDKASFCVYDEGFRREDEWALDIKSVIVFGRIEFIEDQETVYQISKELSRKFTDDDEYIQREIERSGPGTLMFAHVPEHITGKIVHES